MFTHKKGRRKASRKAKKINEMKVKVHRSSYMQG